MYGTIDPGSCIWWVLGFDIKTGYDIDHLRHWKVFWIQKQWYLNCFNIIILCTENVLIYAIGLMSFKFHHCLVNIHHIFWLNFRIILYYIIIELVALGNSDATISVTFIWLAFGRINWHSANYSPYLKNTRGVLMRISIMGAAQIWLE
jgi:hypothetical protein